MMCARNVLRSFMLVAIVLVVGISMLLFLNHYPGRVYTVAEILSGLRHHPQQWVGHTVLVHGVAIVNYCPRTCPYRPQMLIDTQAPYSPPLFCPPPQSIVFQWTIDPHVGFLLN